MRRAHARSTSVAPLRRFAAAAGRDMSTFSVTVSRRPADANVLAEHARAGIHTPLLELPDEPRNELFGLLDSCAKLLT